MGARGDPKGVFFPSPAGKFVLFFPLWGSSMNFGGVLKRRGSNVHVWSSRVVVCEPRRPGLVGPPQQEKSEEKKKQGKRKKERVNEETEQTPFVRLRPINFDVAHVSTDGRRLEVVAEGLSLFGGNQWFSTPRWC